MMSVYVCLGCESPEYLYTDFHGTYCSHCGPSVPVVTSEELERRKGGRTNRAATIDARHPWRRK